jgi:hypothetical protein
MTASVFTWIDHSEAERRKMLHVIDMFRERGTRDELGLSVMRDAFADALFPGTGSVQRRARYFFFVPWMFERLEREGVRSADIARRAMSFEVQLIDTLKKEEDREGVIGIQRREKLQRFPSSIYWQGLRRLGFRLFKGTPDDYYKSLDGWYKRRRSTLHNDDGEVVDGPGLNWRPGIPDAPKGFPESVSFQMTSAEADYLRERIVSEARSSLLAFLADRSRAESDVPFVWDHPLAVEAPREAAQLLEHARNFAEVVHGASILYNLMLAEAEPVRVELLEELREVFEDWRAVIKLREADLRSWTRPEFWAAVAATGGRPSPATRSFVDAWLDMVINARDPRGLMDFKDARDLIARRERKLKGALARLSNPRARELWNGSSGLGRLDYRWANAQVMLNDMLRAEGHHA